MVAFILGRSLLLAFALFVLALMRMKMIKTRTGEVKVVWVPVKRTNLRVRCGAIDTVLR